MLHNIVTFLDKDEEETLALLKLSCTTYKFVPYYVLEDGSVIATEVQHGGGKQNGTRTGVPLVRKFRRMLQEMDVAARKQHKEYFLSALRKARENSKGEELKEELGRIKKMMDEDPRLYSGDIIVQLLLTYRDMQDYDAMVNLVEQLPVDEQTQKAAVQQHYAFALNRRKNEGDREKALAILKEVLKKKENHVPDLLCLCGRIYKDIFVESEYGDQESLENAIVWYRQGFDVQPNVYAGINLATLLVISGKQFNKSTELQRIGITLNNLLGKKGSLESLQDYWDVATFFEISVLAEDYSKACAAAECMFKMKPPVWYLKSTLGNINLINSLRKDETENVSQEKTGFDFWMDFFVEATVETTAAVRFPVLVLEPSKIYVPSYVVVHTDTDEKSIELCHVCWPQSLEKFPHNWKFSADSIKSVSLYKREERCLFLYVQENSDDFQVFFPSIAHRQRFHELSMRIVDLEEVGQDIDQEEEGFPYEYEYDEKTNERVILGRGTFGVVYAGFHSSTKQRLAIKEVPEKDKSDVQPLHEEIRLHQQLHNNNIVRYLGSRSEDGFFKIFMERVPGGSLASLLKKHWGPLKNDEKIIRHYTRQIVAGLNYLHNQKIVHRDIKGDNVLVNTYSGVVKISDFGTSKRLSGINPSSASFTGTMQFMAPEVIDAGQRGYGMKADIWSLGCTVIEMATGLPPFFELGSPHAAVFKVGFHKIHPDIPEEMSEDAKSFLKRCFDPNPGTRASAVELLQHPFLAVKRTKSGDSKKRPNSVATTLPEDRYQRSYSTPVLQDANTASSVDNRTASKYVEVLLWK
ncbi:mitogen-activated protein kinase kinase kinase 15-like [Corticium candelabrum]|uniref:mitogen-activated protein kinase kinase kinase 15-like n=1 Tax=Corticium candelabrum TaxID=121492 RepID=UPI002E2767FB|nr:mitogen-activated protein kinase kinase kinase 15-like [Corticium candelabrum]